MASSRLRLIFRGLLLSIPVGLVAASLLRPSRPKQTANAPLPGAPLRVIEPNANGMIALRGPDVLARIHNSRSKGVLINAWASWCGPCKQEVPLLLKIKNTLHDIDVVFISVDEQESQPQAVSLLKDFGAKGPAYVVDGPLGEFKSVMNPRWKGMIPASFLYDNTPKLHYFWGGPVFEDELLPLLKRYLAGENIDGEAHFALTNGRIDRE